MYRSSSRAARATKRNLPQKKKKEKKKLSLEITVPKARATGHCIRTKNWDSVCINYVLDHSTKQFSRTTRTVWWYTPIIPSLERRGR